MIKLIKEFIKKTRIYPWFRSMRHRLELKRWHKLGRPSPPPHIVKQQAIKEFASRFGLKVLVET